MTAPERVYIAWPNAQSCGLAFTRPADNRTEYTRTPDPLLAEALEALREASAYLHGGNPINVAGGHRNDYLREKLGAVLAKWEGR